MQKPTTINQYLQTLEPAIAERITQIRTTIKQHYPEAGESIRYNMPAWKINNEHFYFAGYKNHIGMYPLYKNTDLEEELKPYRGKNTKDSLHFPHNKPLPIALILKWIAFKTQSTQP